jgi:hypothetical protein
VCRPRPGDAAPPQSAGPAAAGFVAAGHAAVRKGLALLEAAPEKPEPEQRDVPPERAPPWSADWLAAVFRRWTALDGSPETVGAVPGYALAERVGTVEAAPRGDPGLIGACRALIRLHLLDDPRAERTREPDTFEDALSRRLGDYGRSGAAGFWSSIARLGAPHPAAPRLRPQPRPPAADGRFRRQCETIFREILAGPEDPAVGWLLDRIATLAAAVGKRRKDSRVPDLLTGCGASRR